MSERKHGPNTFKFNSLFILSYQMENKWKKKEIEISFEMLFSDINQITSWLLCSLKRLHNDLDRGQGCSNRI